MTDVYLQNLNVSDTAPSKQTSWKKKNPRKALERIYVDWSEDTTQNV